MKIILLCVVLFAGFSSYGHEKIDVVYYKSHNPPFQFDNNEYEAGFITKIINSLDNLEVTFTPKPLSFHHMIKEMSTSEQHWITYGSKSWIGAQSTFLSDISVWKVEHVLFTLKSNPFEGIQSLFSQTIVLIDGFDYPGLDSYINKGLIKKVIRVKTPELAIVSVLNGDADAYPDMRSRIKYHLAKIDLGKNHIELHDIVDIIPNYEMNLCFSKYFPLDIKADIEIQLRNMKRSREFGNIMNSFF